MQLSIALFGNTGNHHLVVASTVNILYIYKRFIDSLQLSI